MNHEETPLTSAELRLMNAYWRAANYLSVGQIYLLDNPLLKEPLRLEHIKPRLLGHWGTTPGLNLIYVHMNRIIRKHDLNAIYIAGPGHGGPGLVANTYLEGTYCEYYPHVTCDERGMKHLFKQFSFPGGIPSHVAPETPGSIHEGGELGYSLAHAYGAVFDNPDLLACCVVGDGESETGALAASWHSNKFLNPARDGAVLPILHLNGYKIAGPTVLARIPEKELSELLVGYGYRPYFVAGDEPELVHQAMAAALDRIVPEIRAIQHLAREHGFSERPTWPMIVLRTPKGWTGPKVVDGLKVEGTFRAHQVPVTNMASKPEHIRILEDWMKSYHAEELFDGEGTLIPELAALAPEGDRRMGANPHANGGLLLKELHLPDFRSYAVEVKKPGGVDGEATRVMGEFLRDVMKLNAGAQNFRVFGPDETASNRLGALFEVTDRTSTAEIIPDDDHVSPTGRVMEILSEHMCEGWLEGYLLTGRHGLFSCYEAFIHIIDSMFNQHAKWLKVTRHIPWRRPIASLNYLLTSHVWRQDHNGFSHQDPGFIDHAVNKKADVVRVYLPPDANTLLSVTDHCLRSRNYVNVIVAGKQPAPQWLDMESAVKHCTAGIGIWEWASNDAGIEPDVVMACCGDVPTLETLAAVDLLREHVPDLKIRVVNVVDLMTLEPHSEHPHGLTDWDFDAIFTKDKPVVFAFHGYPWLIHRLTYRRTNHDNLHVRGYKEEGTTTTPFDMTVLNDLDRFHLAGDVVDRVERLGNSAAHFKQFLRDKLVEHREYVTQRGEDMPEIRDWKWSGAISILAALALQPDAAVLRGVFEEALSRRQEQFGVFDGRTAQAARDLGMFLGSQGATAEARNILDQVVRIDEKVFGGEAAQTLADVAELAAVSGPAQAEPLWKRASKAASAGVSARAFAELGKLHALGGDRAGAAAFYRSALAKDEPKDGETAALHLNALAKLTDAAEAILLLERALAIDRRILGARHAETATTEANLAGLLVDTPRNEEAIRLGSEALAVFRETVGPDHPRTAIAASILGYGYEVKGDRSRAERMYRLALAIDERAYGAGHPQTVNDARVLNEFLRVPPK